jgi:hypothetical protein
MGRLLDAQRGVVQYGEPSHRGATAPRPAALELDAAQALATACWSRRIV